jgi:hypothetical protein
MHIARTRTLLWLTSVAAVALAALAIVAAVRMPLATDDVLARATPSALPSTQTSRPSALPPLASFAPAWKLRLRRPLVDPPPPVRLASAKSPKRAKPAIRLIGTVVDGKQSKGLFMTGLTTIEFKAVGQTIAGAQVLAIDDNTATLSTGGDPFILKRERTPFDSTGASYDEIVRPSASVNRKSDAEEGS